MLNKLAFLFSIILTYGYSYADNTEIIRKIAIVDPHLNTFFSGTNCFATDSIFLGCYGTDLEGNTYNLDIPEELKKYIEETEIENQHLLVVTWTEVVQ